MIILAQKILIYFTKDKMQNKVKKTKIKKDKNDKKFSHSFVDNAVFGYRA